MVVVVVVVVVVGFGFNIDFSHCFVADTFCPASRLRHFRTVQVMPHFVFMFVAAYIWVSHRTVKSTCGKRLLKGIQPAG
jgi:hypothetical protein